MILDTPLGCRTFARRVGGLLGRARGRHARAVVQDRGGLSRLPRNHGTVSLTVGDAAVTLTTIRDGVSAWTPVRVEIDDAHPGSLPIR